MTVYYKVENSTVWYTNQQYKEGYTKLPENPTITENKHVIIELVTDKFVLPSDCYHLFRGCTNTTFNDMDKGVTTSVESMYYMFVGCKNLTEVDLSSGSLPMCKLTTGIFSECTSLSKITGPETLDLSASMSGFSNFFNNCTSLTYLDLSSGTNIPGGIQIFTAGMFYNCYNLERIDVAKNSNGSGTILEDHSENMFYNCTKLKNGDGTTNITKAYNTDRDGYFSVPSIYVTWKNGDGTILEGPNEVDTSIIYTPVYHGPTPTRPAPDVYNCYEFTGGDPDPSDGDKKTTVYTAQYTLKTAYYTIRFLRSSGSSTALQEDQLEYGAVPVYSGPTPTRQHSYGYVYSFTGGNPSIEPVTKDQDYIAQYRSLVNPKIPTIYYHNGTEGELVENIHYRTYSGRRVFPLIKENNIGKELVLRDN